MTNILINKEKTNLACQINMASGSWMAGKKSLHMDNIVYYQIVASEINSVEGAIERRAANWPPSRYPPLVEALYAN
jgi:hypothetical protein